jgi:hypothetical protein
MTPNGATGRRTGKDGGARLLGVGLDNRDGHARVTKGEDFLLVGGSEETHERMTETAIHLNEALDQRGKGLADISKEEFVEILHQVIDR